MSSRNPQKVLERCREYLRRMPPSISGYGGHVAMLKAAKIAAVGFDLSDEVAFDILTEFNARCEPPWSKFEIRHKIIEARKGPARKGFLLDEKYPPLYQAHFVAPAEQKKVVDETGEKIEKRRQWPKMTSLTDEQARHIAHLRKLPSANACTLLSRRGMLGVCEWRGLDCFVVGEGNFAQVRRMDGELFVRYDGVRIKALNLPGGEGAFLGEKLLGTAPNVLLVEGAVALLEGVAGIANNDAFDRWTVIAATSAGSRFARDPELLEKLRGRHVRIVPDNDEAGAQGAAAWAAALKASGIDGDIIHPPEGSKDFGDAINQSPEWVGTLFNQ